MRKGNASSAGGVREPRILDALKQALHDRRQAHLGSLVHHSDRRTQYLSIKYTERVAEAGIENAWQNRYVTGPDGKWQFVTTRRTT